jgi:hypothetical protein
MPTMSHTAHQRKAWHAGKRRPHETNYECFLRCYRAKNHRGANTPPRLKKYISYTPIKEATNV